MQKKILLKKKNQVRESGALSAGLSIYTPLLPSLYSRPMRASMPHGASGARVGKITSILYHVCIIQ